MAMNPRLLRPRATSAYDADAQVYFNAVAIADGQQLEPAVKKAISDFVKGCKADGIWSAIKASCILMGARTLSGALTPLVGAAPTNENFVAGDYSRKTGLKGNATNKRLNTNRLNSADPQNSKSFGVLVTEARTSGQVFMGATAATVGTSHIVDSGGLLFFRVNSSTASATNQASTQTGLHAAVRSSSSALSYVIGASSGTASDTSATPTSDNFFVFDRATTQSPVDIRASFYWIGEFITLSTIQSRISSLVTAIGAAIP